MRRVLGNFQNFCGRTAAGLFAAKRVIGVAGPANTSRLVVVPAPACTPHKYGTIDSLPLQVRNYIAVTTDLARCWNCEKITKRVQYMICSECGSLQDCEIDPEYFDFFSLPKSFNLQPEELTKRFRQLQTLVHPDKFANKPEMEQDISENWASFINAAYRTLLVPIDRAQYLLKLHGQQMPSENTDADRALLANMLERNIDVEEAETKDELERQAAGVDKEISEYVAELGKEFEALHLEAAARIIIKMKYLLSLQENIKNKIEKKFSEQI